MQALCSSALRRMHSVASRSTFSNCTLVKGPQLALQQSLPKVAANSVSALQGPVVAIPARALSSISCRRVPDFVITTNASPTTSHRTPLAGMNTVPVRTFSDYPDHIPLGLPALSPSMETGTLVSWNKNEGDEVASGDVIAEVETDKATVAWESTEDGYLAKILIPAGTEDIQIGALAGILAYEAEDVAAFKDYQADSAAAPASTEAAAEPAPAEATPAAEPVPAAAAASTSSGGRVVASPYARTLANQKGIDISSVAGTGPSGRVIAADIEEFKAPAASATTSAAKPSAKATAAPVPAADENDYEDIPLTNMRKTIAKRLSQSKDTIPHYYLTADIQVDQLLRVRAELNKSAEVKLSVNDFIVKASALALRQVPGVNASWMDTAIRQYKYVDVSVAVATDAGLITPVVQDADIKGLERISADVKALAQKARENKLQPDEFTGGTFTISNLGMMGVNHFSAIINPPQSAILAVGTTTQRVVPDPEAAADAVAPFKTSSFMSVTLSCDHRVVDGALGAQWLQSFRKYLEDPLKMLL